VLNIFLIGKYHINLYYSQEEYDMAKTVDDLKPGETGVVRTHRVKGTLGKHLREMGLINGIPIKLERKAPLGYPVEIRIQGFSLALRK
jgi:Fe2+ transport system protein FeoA